MKEPEESSPTDEGPSRLHGGTGNASGAKPGQIAAIGLLLLGLAGGGLWWTSQLWQAGGASGSVARASAGLFFFLPLKPAAFLVGACSLLLLRRALKTLDRALYGYRSPESEEVASVHRRRLLVEILRTAQALLLFRAGQSQSLPGPPDRNSPRLPTSEHSSTPEQDAENREGRKG